MITELYAEVSEHVNVFDTEVEVKSKLNNSNDKVYIDISLPETSEVGFEIYDASMKIQHLWHDQSLGTGRHQLSLTLPQLEKGKYLLHIKVGDETFKHLVIL